jgi:hypothetical protein
VVNPSPGFEIRPWTLGFAAAVDEYDTQLTHLAGQLAGRSHADELCGHLQRFGEQALAAGLFTALIGVPAIQEKRRIAEALAPTGTKQHISLAAQARAEVEKLLR